MEKLNCDRMNDLYNKFLVCRTGAVYYLWEFCREVIKNIPAMTSALDNPSLYRLYGRSVSKLLYDVVLWRASIKGKKRYADYRFVVATILKVYIHDVVKMHYLSNAELCGVDGVEEWMLNMESSISQQGFSQELYAIILQKSPKDILEIMLCSPNYKTYEFALETLSFSLYLSTVTWQYPKNIKPNLTVPFDSLFAYWKSFLVYHQMMRTVNPEIYYHQTKNLASIDSSPEFTGVPCKSKVGSDGDADVASTSISNHQPNLRSSRKREISFNQLSNKRRSKEMIKVCDKRVCALKNDYGKEQLYAFSAVTDVEEIMKFTTSSIGTFAASLALNLTRQLVRERQLADCSAVALIRSLDLDCMFVKFNVAIDGLKSISITPFRSLLSQSNNDILKPFSSMNGCNIYMVDDDWIQTYASPLADLLKVFQYQFQFIFPLKEVSGTYLIHSVSCDVDGTFNSDYDEFDQQSAIFGPSQMSYYAILGIHSKTRLALRKDGVVKTVDIDPGEILICCANIEYSCQFENEDHFLIRFFIFSPFWRPKNF